MILSSKQVLLISAAEHKQFFMFDPKTTAVVHKYRTSQSIKPHHVYHEHSQQILAQQKDRTFISVWNWDAQEVQLKISMPESMSALTVSQDGHYLYGGSQTGNLYLWELPSGLLLKKKALHSSALTKILPFRQNHILTVSKTQLKIWTLASLLIEQDASPPLKNYTTVLDIISVNHSRNIIAVLTLKSLTLLKGSLNTESRQLQIHQKIDYECPTVMAISNSNAFVGDGKGNIEIVELLPREEAQLELHFKSQANDMVEITKAKKRRVLNGSKHPVTSLVYVDTLGYLVSGHANGQVYVWNNYEIKKSLFLFKSSIVGMTIISKPSEHKIFQIDKIKPLNKHEMSKEQQLLELIPSNKIQFNENKHLEVQTEPRNEEEEILERMMNALRQPQKLLREEVEALRKQRAKLMEANQHYFKMLVP